FFCVGDDVKAKLRQAEEIVQQELYTLRMGALASQPLVPWAAKAGFRSMPSRGSSRPREDRSGKALSLQGRSFTLMQPAAVLPCSSQYAERWIHPRGCEPYRLHRCG